MHNEDRYEEVWALLVFYDQLANVYSYVVCEEHSFDSIFISQYRKRSIG